jgi:hypothetical protein
MNADESLYRKAGTKPLYQPPMNADDSDQKQNLYINRR